MCNAHSSIMLSQQCYCLLVCFTTLTSTLSSVYALNDTIVRQRWTEYKEAYNKRYRNPGVDYIRMVLFLRTDALVESHNAINKHYTIGHNHFSDQLFWERSRFLGLVPPNSFGMNQEEYEKGSPGSHQVKYNQSAEHAEMDPFIKDVLSKTIVPNSLDYRNDSCVGPIKDQGSCGSCWAFAVISPIEFSHCKKNSGVYTSLSEQELVDCDFLDHGCFGGWPLNALAFLTLAGARTEASYPYRSQKGICRPLPMLNMFNKVKLVGFGPAITEPVIKAALIAFGPISVTIYVDNKFHMYKSGVFYSVMCSLLQLRPNHAVTIVGYGQEGLLPYWIVRNQWGTGWGEKGYMRIVRGIDMCGIENNGNFVIAL